MIDYKPTCEEDCNLVNRIQTHRMTGRAPHNGPWKGYLTSDFTFRFRGKMSSSMEDANVDHVKITGA